MIIDPIGDFLTRIRNAIERKKETVEIPSSKMLVSVAEILKKEGFITGYSVKEEKPQNTLILELKYVNGLPAIRELVRVSKPGIRKYVGYKNVKKIMNGMGVAILTTPAGIVTGDEAKKQKIGGEYLCYIY
ncbi:MAG: 30S ribosomal protein S8 [Candidatus Dojkabacteria bacterium]